MLEIERKFLVLSEAFKTEAFKKTKIVQGFLNTHKEQNKNCTRFFKHS